MPFRLREHTADVAIEAEAATLGDLFAALADGVAAAQCEQIPEAGRRFAVEVEAESLEAACFDYLDQLVYERDVRSVLPAANEAAVTEREGRWVVDGSARGVPLDAIRAREIKAVTYSEMRVEQTDDGWAAYVVLDV